MRDKLSDISVIKDPSQVRSSERCDGCLRLSQGHLDVGDVGVASVKRVFLEERSSERAVRISRN